ncbi:MAG: PQQ-binding-like beta-propeller repeat protein [Vicinamibacterales bacterium]
MRINYVACIGFMALVGLVSVDARQPSTMDWPQWRGQNRDGAAAATAVPRKWPERLTARWTVEVGLGYSAPIIVGNTVYAFSRQEPNEVLRALDAATGKTRWESSYAAPFKPNPAATKRHGTGPKSTPAFADGKLFTLGMSGIVTAFDAASGRQIWQKAAPPVEPLYHTAMSPLVDRGLVILHVGGTR